MKRIVVTSAQMGAKVNTRFLNSLRNYCKLNKAELLIIPLKGFGNNTYEYDSSLSDYLIDDSQHHVTLNENVCVSTMKINPAQINPLSGLKRLTNESIIYGSPKLAMEPVPTSNRTMPKVIMTTGAVTQPFYSLVSKQGRIAKEDHTYGAVIVEVVDNKMFHFRHIESNDNGEFTDLAKKYSTNTVTENPAVAFIMGDTHVGSIPENITKATDEMIKLLKPKELIFHDLMDTYSVNHHHENNLILKTHKAESLRGDLKLELEAVADHLLQMKKHGAKMVVVASNHNDALDRYIKHGRFFEDYRNLRISLKLCLEMLDNTTSVEAYIRKLAGSETAEALKDVVFLGLDDDYILAGNQLANHGHLGINGARGSIKSQEIGAKRSIIGHSHTPGRWHRVVQVGTSTHLKLEYNPGFSSWMNTHAPLYKDGTRQLLNIIDGNWKA